MTDGWLQDLIAGCEFGCWPDSMRWIPTESCEPARLDELDPTTVLGLRLVELSGSLTRLGEIVEAAGPQLQRLVGQISETYPREAQG